MSNPTVAGLGYDAAEILAAFGDPNALRYEPEPFGLVAARAHLGQSVVRGVDPSRIVLTASTSEAYGYAFKLLCDPGDEVLVPQPSYPLLEHLAQFDAVTLVPYRLAYDGAWHIDLDSVRRAVGPRTRAVVVVTPNNPTGSYLSSSELAALEELGHPIISDEVFAEYPLDANAKRAESARLARGVIVLALGGLSKLAALPQMKLAWMTVTGPEADVAEALARLELIADAYLSVATPVQHALPALLAAGGRVRHAIQQRTRENLELLRGALAGTAATVLRCEGGWYAVVRLPNTASEDEWAIGLLERERVLVQPGWLYDFHEQPYVVVSLLAQPDDMTVGADRLSRFVG